MAPASNSSSSYYLIKSCSFGLWRYIFLAMGSVPGLTGISCTSPSPLSGGTVLGNSGGNTLLNSFNSLSKTPLCSSGRPKRCGTAPSGKSWVPIQQLLEGCNWAPTLLDQLSVVRGSLQNLPSSSNKPIMPAGIWYLCLNPLHHPHILYNKGSLPPQGPWDSQCG